MIKEITQQLIQIWYRNLATYYSNEIQTPEFLPFLLQFLWVIYTVGPKIVFAMAQTQPSGYILTATINNNNKNNNNNEDRDKHLTFIEYCSVCTALQLIDYVDSRARSVRSDIRLVNCHGAIMWPVDIMVRRRQHTENQFLSRTSW